MLAHERFGKGAPLVLIHGIGHRRQGWKPVVDILSREREVILVDLPGHGDSPNYEPGDRTAKDYLRDCFVELFEELDLGRPHVAGNSLGGLIALELANDHLVSSATALSPAGFWRGEADFKYIKRLFGSAVAAARYTNVLAPVLSRSSAGRFAMYSWLTARPGRIESKAALGDFRAMLRARSTLETLIKQGYVFEPNLGCEVPVTIAWGTRDRVLRPYQADRARVLLPNANHIWLRGCGHVPMSDRPKLVAEVILNGSAQSARSPLAAVSAS